MKRTFPLCIIALAFFFAAATAAPASPRTGGAAAGDRAMKASYLKLPLSFVKNQGQKDSSVLYYEQGAGHATAFTKDGVALSLGRKGSYETVTLTPVGASPHTVEAMDRKEGKVNYFTGSDPRGWKTNIPTYGAILYKNVYPGIDMKFYGTGTQLEYDLIVSPGADPSRIRLSYKGAKKLSLTPKGEMEVSLKEGAIYQKKLHLYQTIAGKKVEVEGKFILADATTHGFEVGKYDRNHPLVIDPVIVYSTYLGGAGNDRAYAIAVDSSGSAYVTGYTDSDPFPVTAGAVIATYGGAGDAFVTKFSASGGLVYSTYLGGSSYDEARAIAVDSSGYAYVTGYTYSSNFPTTSTAYRASLTGSTSIFVTKLSPAGDSLAYSTYLGETSYGSSCGIAVDSSGYAYVTGGTRSTSFPTTTSAYKTSKTGTDNDIFVSKIDTAASGTASLVYSTYLGGSANNWANAVAVGSSGNVYITGATTSYNFPTKNAYQTPAGTMPNPIVSQIDTTKSGTASLIYSTSLGGDGNDEAGAAIAVDSSGYVYVTGWTNSTNFPTTAGAFQTANAGTYDVFIAKLDTTLTTTNTLVYSTYLGGTAQDSGRGIAVDASGCVYVTGKAVSTNFPTRNIVTGTTSGGLYDPFITKLDTTKSGADGLVFSTYFGGQDSDEGLGIAVDAANNVYVTGQTNSGDFPLMNAYQPALGGTAGMSYDAFVAKLNDHTLTVSKAGTGSGTVTSSPAAIDCGSVCTNGLGDGVSVVLTATPATGSTFTSFSGCTSTSGNTCTVTMSADTTVTVTFTANSYTVTASVSSGNGTALPATQAVLYGHSATIGMTPDTGYRIAGVTDNGAPVGTWSAGTTSKKTAGKKVKSSAKATAAAKSSPSAPPPGTSYTITNVTADHAVVVTFGSNTAALTVTKAGAGVGTVTCNGAACTSTYPYGTSVTLTATPGSDSTFTGWSGSGCSGTGTCVVAMTEARAVTATFQSCTYAINPITKSFPYRGGFTNVTVTANGTSCVSPAITVSDSSWITTSMGKFTRNRGVLKITTTNNSSVQVRNGIVTVHASAFGVAQAAGPCALNSITPVRNTATPAGEPGTFAVDATAGCTWNVTSPNWITATSSGNGPGTVSYTPAPNTTGRLRNGTITVALQSAPTKKKIFTLKQSACTLAVSPPNRTFNSTGGNDTLNVTSPTGCPWNVTSSAAWLTATASGTGTSPVSYTADPNTTGRQRSARLTVSLTDTPTIKRLFTVTERR